MNVEMLSKVGEKQCFFCAIRELSVFSCFVGVCCFTSTCIHYPKDDFQIKVSSTAILMSVISGMVAILSILELFHANFVRLEKNMEPSYYFKLYADLVTGLIIALVIIYRAISKVEQHISLYKSLRYLVQREQYTKNQLFSKKSFQKVQRSSRRSIISCLFLSTLYAWLSGRCLTFIIGYTYLIMTSCFAVDLEIFQEIMQNNFSNLKRSLAMARRHSKSDFLIEQMKRVQNIHSYVIISLNLFIHSSALAALLGTVQAVVFTILYLYLFMVSMLFNADEGVIENISLAVTLSLSLSPILYDIFRAEQLNRVVSTF